MAAKGYDVIVVGLGAHGAATLYQLARRGARVLGVDRWSPPHAFGSSHGETRATRQGVGEGAAFAPLVLRSHEIWRELEALNGEILLLTCGMLFIGVEGGQVHGAADFIGRSAEVARRFGVAHETFGGDEVRRRYPQFLTRGDELAYFEPGGGLVFPERCIAAQLAQAERAGASVLRDRTVRAVEEDAAGARVVLDDAVLSAEQVVVAAGAWTGGLVGASLGELALRPQLLHWFACEDAKAFGPDRFPVFNWMYGAGAEDTVYGFPTVDAQSPLVKVATETTATIASPDALERSPPPSAADALYARALRGRVQGLRPSAVRSAVCLYAATPDANFRLGFVREGGRVFAVSACSGHGFKHSAGLGEEIAKRLLGEDDSSALSAFALPHTAAGSPAGRGAHD